MSAGAWAHDRSGDFRCDACQARGAHGGNALGDQQAQIPSSMPDLLLLLLLLLSLSFVIQASYQIPATRFGDLSRAACLFIRRVFSRSYTSSVINIRHERLQEDQEPQGSRPPRFIVRSATATMTTPTTQSSLIRRISPISIPPRQSSAATNTVDHDPALATPPHPSVLGQIFLQHNMFQESSSAGATGDHRALVEGKWALVTHSLTHSLVDLMDGLLGFSLNNQELESAQFELVRLQKTLELADQQQQLHDATARIYTLLTAAENQLADSERAIILIIALTRILRGCYQC